MNEQIVSNIIKYVIEKNIIEVAIPVFGAIDNNHSTLIELDEDSVWFEISKDFKFDKISIHLLDNFSNVIDREDYLAAYAMKKELIRRWEYLDENYLWNTGRKYLKALRKGIPNSTFNHLINTVGEIEYMWKTRKFNAYVFVMNKLIGISDEINNYPIDCIKDEISDSIFASKKDYTHPLLIIDSVIDFFKIIETDTGKNIQ